MANDRVGLPVPEVAGISTQASAARSFSGQKQTLPINSKPRSAGFLKLLDRPQKDLSGFTRKALIATTPDINVGGKWTNIRGASDAVLVPLERPC
jgi:hypothetical protein